MNSPTQQQIEGNWKQFVGQVKSTWGELTNDDLDQFKGQRDILEGKIQEKTGEDRAAIRRKMDEIAESLKSTV